MSGKQIRDSVHFRLYPDDALSSPTLAGMTDEKLGCWFRLLCLSWGGDGLPAEPEQIARLLRRKGRDFDSVWPVLDEAFPIAEDGRRRSPRLERERAALREWKAGLSDRGKAGAEARWGKREGEAE